MVQQTPPMGWNSWNTFGENINEQLIFDTADRMVETGLRDAGYEYLVIKYSGLTKGNLLNIYILPINPVAYSLSKEQSLCLSYFLKSGFIYFDYSVFLSLLLVVLVDKLQLLFGNKFLSCCH